MMTRGPSLACVQMTEPDLSVARGPTSSSSSMKIARTSSSKPEIECASVSSWSREMALLRM
jgi:hypothetical protein